MSLIQNRTMHPYLREDDVLVIENAIRIAIDSIINVLYSVNNARTQEYKRMVADKDKEIQQIECKAKQLEVEFQALRRQKCPCGLIGKVGPDVSDEPVADQGTSFEPARNDSEITTREDCEMNISCLFTSAPSQVPALNHDSAPSSASSMMGMERSSASHSSDSPCLSNETRNPSPGTDSLIVKEEPSDIDTVLIKWEMSEQHLEDHQDNLDMSCQDEETPINRKLDSEEALRQFREKLYTDPEAHFVYTEKELPSPRTNKRGSSMSELPEETQQQKRAAWRAASRRYYARKVARQQANPPLATPPPQNRPPPLPLPAPSVDKKRRTLISELPEETQSLQREAWRAASRRYYARKMARLQAKSAGLSHFLQTTDALGGAHGHSSGGVEVEGLLWDNIG